MNRRISDLRGAKDYSNRNRNQSVTHRPLQESLSEVSSYGKSRSISPTERN